MPIATSTGSTAIGEALRAERAVVLGTLLRGGDGLAQIADQARAVVRADPLRRAREIRSAAGLVPERPER